MNSNLKRRIERLEQAVGTDSDDPRAYCYPNDFAELAIRATKGKEEWQKFLQTRRSKPNPRFWDWIDQKVRQLRKNKVKKHADIDRAERM